MYNIMPDMKKILILLILFVFSVGTAYSQQYDVLDKVKADVRKSDGMEGPFRFDGLKPLTKAPAGYKAFYISHYARHGSRYSSSSRTYTIIHDVLDKANELGVLTPYGQELRNKYESFYLQDLGADTEDMSRVILCSGKRADVPFVMKASGRKVYTVEELCYCLRDELETLDGDTLGRELADFLGRELGLTERAQTLRKLVDEGSELKSRLVVVLCASDLYTAPEINEICEDFEKNLNMTPLLRAKKIADRNLLEGRSKVALSGYRDILSDVTTSINKLPRSPPLTPGSPRSRMRML